MDDHHKLHFVYVLVSEVNQSTYIGATDDLERRIVEHNRGATRSIKKWIPYRLHYYETYLTKSEARKRESQLKNSSWHKKELFDRIFGLQEGSISPKR